MCAQSSISDYLARDPGEYRYNCFQAKGRSCICCDSDSDIVVHHIDGDEQNNSLENLIPVCRTCHIGIHSGRDEFKEYHQHLPESSRTDKQMAAASENATLFERKVSSAGIVTIPKDIRRAQGLSKGDSVIIEIEVL